MRHLKVSVSLFLLALFAPAFTAVASAAPGDNTTRGQGQMAGGDGEFGTVYSMKDGFNEEILSAKYSIDPIVCYNGDGFLAPGDGEKLLVLEVAMKNATPTDNFNGGWNMTAVDSDGTEYGVTVTRLASDGPKAFGPTLKPGQGLGQPELHNPMEILFKIPSKARIVKLIMNQGRLNHEEDVFRYYVAGATAAEAGKAGDPKNIIAALPQFVRDPGDPSGATAIDPGKGGQPGGGVSCPSSRYFVTLDSFGDAPQGAQFDGSGPDDGKKFVFATMTMHNASSDDGPVYDFDGGKLQLTDSNGDTYDMMGVEQAGADEKVADDHKVPAGQQYTVRVLFSAPANVTIKSLTFAGSGGRAWLFDLGK